MHKLLSKIGWHSFKNGLCNLIRWFPVIWQDRDYDEAYLYEILHKKLDHMEDFFRSENSFTADANKTANEIKEAKDIVKRLLDNAYFADLTKDINTNEIFSIDKCVFKTNREHPQYQEWLYSHDLAEQLKEKDKRKLFEIMRVKIDNWWD